MVFHTIACEIRLSTLKHQRSAVHSDVANLQAILAGKPANRLLIGTAVPI
jgi:hypothetical protein